MSPAERIPLPNGGPNTGRSAKDRGATRGLDEALEGLARSEEPPTFSRQRRPSDGQLSRRPGLHR